MAPASSALVQEIDGALSAARGFAIGHQHEALAAAHGRIDELVRALATASAEPDQLTHLRREISAHRQLLISLHDAVEATLKRASHAPPTCYGHGARMQSSGARPLLTTRA